MRPALVALPPHLPVLSRVSPAGRHRHLPQLVRARRLQVPAAVRQGHLVQRPVRQLLVNASARPIFTCTAVRAAVCRSSTEQRCAACEGGGGAGVCEGLVLAGLPRSPPWLQQVLAAVLARACQPCLRV